MLSLDNNGRPLQEDGVWGRIFLQLSNQVECVKAAAAAFGAAYESSLNNAVVQSPCSAWSYYGSALARLRLDFKNQTAGPESLALASIILACVEILSEHEQNAFTHFLGAVQILTSSQRRLQAPSANILSTIKDELVRIDVSIGSYAMSQAPAFIHLGSQEAATGGDAFRDPELAINAAMLCLHRVHQFIGSATSRRYKHPSWPEHDPVMCKARSDAVSQCRTVIDGLTALATRLQVRYSTRSTLSDSEMLAEIYATRSQLTSSLIFIICIHSPFETTYDEQYDLFQSIISDAAASIRLRRQSKSSAFKRFSTRPGIISPLFMVSNKCRDPPLRALATEMLSEQGREGPTDGQIMAAIGARLAVLETSGSVPQASSLGAPLAACDVVEGQRIHGYKMSPSRLDGEGRRSVDVEFSRPKVPLEQGWGHVDYSTLDSWIFWTEPLDL